jgi:hypothetical protein
MWIVRAAFAVVFTDRNGEDTEHSLWLSEDAAAEAGAALARRMWDEYGAEDGDFAPFPDSDDDWDAMDALRTAYPVSLEVEPISVSDAVMQELSAIGSLRL